ncbi:MAG: 30S ribosomal protein S9 [Mycoplasmataceae bacterium]|jgi:small subunit ribosomal protein S9|nr:30S ribosomal protein S9 [Mycoplasmataceae bacterium]
MDKVEYKALGRRKTSIARVILTLGTGNITINGHKPTEYFPNTLIIQDMQQPLALTDTNKSFDIKVKVTGGGFRGQAGAIRLAIAQALVLAKNDYKTILKKKKLVTRDARAKERKKYGKYGARRSPQFTKR